MLLPGYPNNTPLAYTGGKIFDQSSFQEQVEKNTEVVVKYGSETGYTKGVFDMQGLCVRRIDYTDKYHTRNITLNNQLVVLSVGDPNTNPFATHGDSGALVFAKCEGNRSDLKAVGIVEGGTSNKAVAVTPLWDVFAYLGRNPQAGLKTFAMPLLRVDSGYISAKTSPILLQGPPGSAELENENEQARSREIAEHFRESQQKQTQELNKLEERMNTRLEKIEQLTESMQREQQEKTEQAQNQQKVMEDKMTQMIEMMQSLMNSRPRDSVEERPPT